MTAESLPTALPPKARRAQDWARRLLRPGKSLMLALPMSIKLALLASCLLGPLLLLMGLSIVERQTARQDTLAERRGIDVIDALVPVIVELEKCRGLTHRVFAGDPSAATLREQSRPALRAAVAGADAVVGQSLPFEIGDIWLPVRARVLELANGTHPPVAAQAFAAHSAVLEQLRQVVWAARERSGLIGTAEHRAAMAVDMLVNLVVPTIDVAGVARSKGASLLAQAPPDADDRATLQLAHSRLSQQLGDIGQRMAAYERAGGRAPAAWASTLQATGTFGAAITGALGNTAVLAPPAFFDAGTRVIDQLQMVNRELRDRARVDIDARQQEIMRTIFVRAGVFLASILVLGYLLAAFFFTFHESLGALTVGAEAMAAGDLSHRFVVRGGDELARIGSLLDRTSDQLSELVAEIRSSASLVNLAGNQVAEGSQKLSLRTDSQAASLRQSSSAISQISDAVAANADAARDLDRLTEDLSAQAEQGQGSMVETMDAMRRMQQTSQRVTEIVTVIDDIAFQTGMLALNAAVEAARAGNAGKGFAVVAAEIRQLAQRCAEAAEEIRALIGTAAAQVTASADKLQYASDSLDRIVGSVHAVSGRLRTITGASIQQGSDLAEVTRGVGSLDEITRENAALVELSASASCALVERAATLRGAVASMRLRRGSADEAHAMVLDAVAHVGQVGREEAFRDFHAADGRFIDRDLYLFGFDRNGIILAFGGDARLVGMPASAIPGLDSSGLIERAWTAADAGGGWVAYEVVNPLTGAIQPKESFVMPLGPSELIGCGAYRHEQTAPPAQPVEPAQATIA